MKLRNQPLIWKIMGQWDSVSLSRTEEVSNQQLISCALHTPFFLLSETLPVPQSNKGKMPSGYQSCTLIPPSLFTPCLASDRLIQSFKWLTLISPKNSCLKQSHQPSGTRAESAWSEWRHLPKSFHSEGCWELGKELCSCTTVTLASNFSPKPTFCSPLKYVTEKICRKPTELISGPAMNCAP